ncbi:Hsp20/alpha crystallin family protein [Desulfothermobacter acidiphilus]|uniref:Hsp20/alpha crystallin family protein n=1 Tax=Desulfothermobacter acidiphilus TaxID=1938353 RepID=UPI003F8AB4A5
MDRPVPWDPWRELQDLEDSINRLMGRLTRPFRGDKRRLVLWFPAVDVLEEGNNIVLRADLPGVSKENVRILVSSDEVTITGEVRREEEVKEKNYYRSERAYGSFSRTIPLPVPVEREKAKATFKDGVLEIVIPKAAGPGPNQVEIKPE